MGHSRTGEIQSYNTSVRRKEHLIFLLILSRYYRGALGAVVVYDITRRESFNDVGRWLFELHEHADQKTVIFLIGNKSDLSEERTVTSEEAEKYAGT